MCQQAHITLQSAPASTAAARRWAARQLLDFYGALPAEVADDVAVVVSELATNCVRSGAGGFDLDLDAHHVRLIIAATDTAPGVPVRRRAAPSAGSGRGLNIIAALSDRWGVTPRELGKTVWVQLAVPQGSGPGFACDFASEQPG